MDGRSFRPSRSGMTRGTPAPSTYATRLLVVPRSMPTMRDMTSLVLSYGLGEIIDYRAQISARSQPLLEALEQRFPSLARVDGGIPFRSPRDQRVFFYLVALLEPLPLRAQLLRRLLGQPGRLGLLQGLLHFEHFREEIHRHLGLRGRLFPHLAPFFQGDQVLDPPYRVAKGSIGAVHERRGLEGAGLVLHPRPLGEVGVVTSRELVEAPLQR